MRRLAILLCLLLWAAAAHAAATITTVSLTAATNACVTAPAGATCSGGAVGALDTKYVIIENTSATADVWCDETSPAVVNQGVLLVPRGGSITLSGQQAIFCISSATATLAVAQG